MNPKHCLTTWFFDGVLLLDHGKPIRIAHSHPFPLANYFEAGIVTDLSVDIIYHSRTFHEQHNFYWIQIKIEGVIDQLFIEDGCTFFILK